MNILLTLLLLTGTWAEDRLTERYGLQGGYICLAVSKEMEGFANFRWKLNSEIIVKNNGTRPEYNKKMDYHHHNYTLCVKNLSMNDSGIYSATVEKEWKEITTKYRLTVQDAVPIPDMQIIYSNSTSGPCNITVNCLGWVLSECLGGWCTPAQSQSQSEYNISVSSNKGHIHCTVNNYVSRRTVSKSIDILCSDEMKETSTVQFRGVLVLVGVFSLVVVVSAGIGFNIWKSFRKQQMQVKPLSVSPNSPVPSPSTESTDVTSIYCVAGQRKRRREQEHLTVLRQMLASDVEQIELNRAQRQRHLQMALDDAAQARDLEAALRRQEIAAMSSFNQAFLP
ncbi:hypothetical protein DPEC_G00095140 [Dallia pectoralis]|uniref:Uncharacterized protein n=1 Tax=Dallia pectoralis TaxID=75939 RepID=A0ACC2GUU8_DALPE|nr:hypothetical protein DPEC_G00095140 [Dallia pectoralis]